MVFSCGHKIIETFTYFSFVRFIEILFWLSFPGFLGFINLHLAALIGIKSPFYVEEYAEKQ